MSVKGRASSSLVLGTVSHVSVWRIGFRKGLGTFFLCTHNEDVVRLLETPPTIRTINWISRQANRYPRATTPPNL